MFLFFSGHAWRGGHTEPIISGLPLQSTSLSFVVMIPYLAISERITESFNDVEPLSKLTLSLIPSMLINSSRHILIAICASRADRAIKNRDVADSKERRRIRREKAKSRKRRRDAMNAFDSTPVKQRLHTMIRLLESDRMATDRNNRKFFLCPSQRLEASRRVPYSRENKH